MKSLLLLKSSFIHAEVLRLLQNLHSISYQDYIVTTEYADGSGKFC